jgi:hypothetical protein
MLRAASESALSGSLIRRLKAVGNGGSQRADYMYMWTTILEGPNGNGDDFDFFYFAGPSDFAKSFKLPAVLTLEALDDYFDARLKDDANFKKSVDGGAVTKAGFRN